MKVNIKKLREDATIPTYAKPGDAGMDLTAVEVEYGLTNDAGEIYHKYHTGLAIEIPEGHVGLIFPRSSIYKKSLSLANSVGVIDSGYRGEICFMYKDTQVDANDMYSQGERIGQLIILPYPQINLVEVDELSSSDRGEGGFGSTGS